MAFLNYRDLLVGPAAPADGPGIGNCDTEMIGAIGVGGNLMPAMAMRLGPSPDDPQQILYLEELPIFFGNWQERRHRFGTDRWHCIRRLEIKAARGQPHVEKGDSILLSELPYGSCVVASASLKARYKDSEKDAPRPVSDVLGSAERMAEWLSAKPVDYWESDHHFLTAAIYGFEEPPRFIEKIQDPKNNAGIAIGLCRDYASTLTALRASAQWAEIRDNTLAGRRRWWGANLRFVPLNEEVMVNIEEILDLAVRQAMAGPHDARGSARLLGTPVMKETGRIFDLHINRLNRRVATTIIHGEPLGPETDVGAEEQRIEGLEEHQYQKISARYGVDTEGARYLSGMALEQGLADRVPRLTDRAMHLLALVWNLPKPAARSAKWREYVERVLADDDLDEARLAQAEALVAKALRPD